MGKYRSLFVQCLYLGAVLKFILVILLNIKPFLHKKQISIIGSICMHQLREIHRIITALFYTF